MDEQEQTSSEGRATSTAMEQAHVRTEGGRGAATLDTATLDTETLTVHHTLTSLRVVREPLEDRLGLLALGSDYDEAHLPVDRQQGLVDGDFSSGRSV